jgi:hypothetical protein
MATTRDAAPTAEFFDPWARLPDGAALRAACEAGDIAAALTIARGLTRHDDIAATLWTIAGHSAGEDQPRLTTAIDAADDGTPLARTLRALRYVKVGWEVRSHAQAQHVSAGQFEQFHDWLRRAERILFDVCAQHPDYVPAWEARVTTSRGLELGAGETRRRYDRLAALDPQVFAAQRACLQQIVPKWGGSWGEASQFVTECAAAAEPGSLGHLLVVDLAIERWADGEKTVPPAMADRVRQAATQSVWHPHHASGAATATAHANLALFFSLANLPADAWLHFDALGQAPVEGMWSYYNGAEAMYRAKRDAAAQAAAKTAGGRTGTHA